MLAGHFWILCPGRVLGRSEWGSGVSLDSGTFTGGQSDPPGNPAPD